LRLQARFGGSSLTLQDVNANPKPLTAEPLSSLALVGADPSRLNMGFPQALDVGVKGTAWPWEVEELRDVAALVHLFVCIMEVRSDCDGEVTWIERVCWGKSTP